MATPRRLTEEAINRAAEKSKVTLRVFVGGPYIDLSKSKAPARKNYGGAQYLRFKICQHVDQVLGHKVTIGEDRNLEEIYRDYFSGSYNAAFMEMAHVVEESDAVIILPSSPGSFLELGYFAANPKVSKKMLVLRNEAFAKRPGYLHFGPSAQAKKLGATVIDAKYDSLNQVLKAVDEFLDETTSSNLAMKYLVG